MVNCTWHGSRQSPEGSAREPRADVVSLLDPPSVPSKCFQLDVMWQAEQCPQSTHIPIPETCEYLTFRRTFAVAIKLRPSQWREHPELSKWVQSDHTSP